MKKIILSGLLVIGMVVGAKASSIVSYTITSNTPMVALTGSYTIKSVQIVGNPYKVSTLFFFDAKTATTNYVLGAYNSVSQGVSNIVTTYVGLTGYTNVYTNSVLWTDYVTNSASTNALPAQGSYIVPINGLLNASPNLNFANGVVLLSNSTDPTNGTQVILTYDRLR